MKRGLLIATKDDVIAFLEEGCEADAKKHLENGYPQLLDDFTEGRLIVKEVDAPETIVPGEYRFDGAALVLLTPQEATDKATREEASYREQTRIQQILAVIDREARRFIALRLLADNRITQDEYDGILAHIGKD